MKSRNADFIAHRGLTLVEVLITMAIFVSLAFFTILAVREVVTAWSQGERRRILHEKAAGVIDLIASDIRLAVTQEPAGVTEVKAKFIGDFDPQTRQQRLMFVRSFESGPERAITFNAGDGQANEMMFGAQDDAAPANSLKKIDDDEFTGLSVGDFKPLGGMAMIAFFAKNQTLYRVIHAPVPEAMSPMLQTDNAQVLATDVLYLGFDYWSQHSKSWDDPKRGSTLAGPERMWDSTRGLTVPPLKNFIMHRGADSAADMDDDVFPEKVRITVTVDSSLPRCVFTKLADDMGDSEIGSIYVDSTRGFPDGGPDSYILIDDEWMRFKDKTEDSFEIDQRGSRGSQPRSHRINSVIRTGKTFRRVVYIPNWREDLETDDAWRARKQAQANKPRRIVK